MQWMEPPPMEAGAPEPIVQDIGHSLLCAYRCDNPDFPGWDSGDSAEHPGYDEYFAILKFEEVESFEFGPPNDESLYNHPLYKKGVDYYGFYKLGYLNDFYHWVITFHDETLQVFAKKATVIHKRIDAASAQDALSSLV